MMTMRSLFVWGALSALYLVGNLVANVAAEPWPQDPDDRAQDPDDRAEEIGEEEERNELLEQIRAERESNRHTKRLLGEDDDDDDDDGKKKVDRDSPEEKLCKAAWRGDTALVRRLVEKERVDIEARAHEDGKATPLFYASCPSSFA